MFYSCSNLISSWSCFFVSKSDLDDCRNTSSIACVFLLSLYDSFFVILLLASSCFLYSKYNRDRFINSVYIQILINIISFTIFLSHKVVKSLALLMALQYFSNRCVHVWWSAYINLTDRSILQLRNDILIEKLFLGLYGWVILLKFLSITVDPKNWLKVYLLWFWQMLDLE